jgi:hypothetical protein
MNEYGYTPLEKGQIRLREILPGEDSDPISCQLRTVSLQRSPAYAALSYTWSTGLADRSIFIDGRRVFVRENLEEALQEFRARPVWIIPKEGYQRV